MRRSIILLALCSLFLAPLMAQEAFYIYRNDGDFNGFFYDEVVEMRYSKLDFDSVEHANYVIYEVELADTLYRIPLAAIDSVSFIQPEIIINPKVRHMDLLGMTPHAVSRWKQQLSFDATLPAELMPQVGDVLFGMTGIFEEENFAGRVTQIYPSSDGCLVITEPLKSLSDIFVQFIAIEEIGFAEDPNEVSYRLAGANKIKQLDGGSYSGTLINIATTLHIPINPGSTVEASIDANIKFVGRMVMVYQIHDDIFFIKFLMREDFNLQTGVTLSMSGDNEKVYPLIPEPFGVIAWPVYPPFPLVEITPVPKLGSRWGGSLSAQLSLPAVSGHLNQTLVIDSELPWGMTFDQSHSFNPPTLNGMFDTFSQSDAEIKLEGFYQVGVKEELAIKTNPVFSSIISAYAGVDFWVGPKLEGSFNFDVKSFVASDDGPYIFRNSHIGVSTLRADMEAYGRIYDCFTYDTIKHKWIDESVDIFPSFDFYATPEFQSFDAKYIDSTKHVIANWKSSPRDCIFPTKAGIALYKTYRGEPVIMESKYSTEETVNNIPVAFNVDWNAIKYKAGTYKMVPTLNLFGSEYLIRSLSKDIQIPFIAELENNTLHFNAAGTNDASISFKTNCPSSGISFVGGDLITSHYIDTIDKDNGLYELHCTATPNKSLFMKPNFKLDEYTWAVKDAYGLDTVPTLTLLATTEESVENQYQIGFTQELNSSPKLYVSVQAGADFSNQGNIRVGFSDVVTATRNGNDIIHISGTKVLDESDVVTLDMTISPKEKSEWESREYFNVSGTIKETSKSGNGILYHSVTYTFQSECPIEDSYWGNYGSCQGGTDQIPLIITSGTYVDGDNQTSNKNSDGYSYMNIHFQSE